MNLKRIVFAVATVASMGCITSATSRIAFPSPDQVFITSGDGDIQKPYTPVGELVHYKTGSRIPLPLLGLLKGADVDPDLEMRTVVVSRIREMGGDGLINMRVNWQPANGGFLGIKASGGMVIITGTVIKR